MPLLLQQTNAMRIQGLPGSDGNNERFLRGTMFRANEDNHSSRRVLTGAEAVTHRLRSYNSRRYESGMWQHTWTDSQNWTNDTLFLFIQRHTGRPAVITCHDSLVTMSWWDGDGSTFEFFSFREVLGDGYANSGSTGLGVNAGSAAANIAVYNANSEVAYTVVYGRTYTINARAGTAGDTAGVTVDGTLTSLVEGVDWTGAAAATDEVAAENLRVAINAISGVSATRSGTVVTVIKDAATLTLSLTTTDQTNLEVHPNGATEIALDIAGTYAWRNFAFQAASAPASGVGNLRAEYHGLFRVRPSLSGFSFPSHRLGTVVTSYALTLREIGVS